MFDLQEFLPYRLYQAAEQTSRVFSDAYSELYGLNRTQWRVLFNIGQFGPLTAREISERTNLEKSRVSRSVVRLEEMGWVLRAADPEDRRRLGLTLTREGRAAFDDLRGLAQEFQARLSQSMGAAELASLVEALRKVEELDPISA